MKTFLRKGAQGFNKLSGFVHSKALVNANALSLTAGLVLVSAGLVDVAMAQDAPDWDQTQIATAAEFLLSMIEGALGALIMIVAGIGAIVAAAMGAYRAAVGMLVVAVGAFILRTLVQLFFGENFQGIDNQ